MSKKIAIIGLGYVGLPLAVEFAKKFKVVGYDINLSRIHQLQKGHDSTLEISDKDLLHVEDNVKFTNKIDEIKDCDVYIVTVPTPIDKANRPNLNPLISASKDVGSILSKNDIVIYESTVYPGVTEDVCAPELEKASGLKFNQDFFCGYSPERINPGDKVNTIAKIKKITSGSTAEIAEEIDKLYQSIITAGTFKASSIKVAEAAKVIENTQRDLNIALVNELSVIFGRLGLDTLDVLEAAGSKWNFLPFRPGLVGGHCIGVDPYYLTHAAEQVRYNPQVILAGRRINDNMAFYLVKKVIQQMTVNGIDLKKSTVGIMGVTFKENCPDIRNSKVADVYNELNEFGLEVDAYDYEATPSEVKEEYGIDLIDQITEKYDGILLAVSHDKFSLIDIESLKKDSKSIVFDLKGFLPRNQVNSRL